MDVHQLPLSARQKAEAACTAAQKWTGRTCRFRATSEEIADFYRKAEFVSGGRIRVR